jgi:serpin B
VTQLLLASDADTAARTGKGRTALDRARDARQTGIVALLSGGDSAGETVTWDNGVFPADDANEVQSEPLTDAERLVRGNTAFALDLYQALRSGPGNLFFSPYSISTALAMTYAAAREDTETEMRETLHFALGQDDLHAAFAGLHQALGEIQAAGNVEIHSANSLWPQQGKPFLTDYLKLVETYYGGSITPVDYTTGVSREAARRTINACVEEQTKAKIKDLVQPSHLSELTRLVLVNAVYFRGKWEGQFDPKDTEDALFYTSLRDSVTVPMMWQQSRLRYAEMASLQVLELPYRGDEVSMLILLPRRIEGLDELEKALSVENLKLCVNRLREGEVIVFLPRFELSFGVQLNATLQTLGMVRAFKWPGANFAGFDGDPEWFYISSVIHKAFVNVNEEGTEAAAATAVVAGLGGIPLAPPVFRADHPFLFLIQEKKTGSLLFLGRVADPTGGRP